jgi:ABC-type multidrug transport system ATPase subunit
MIIEEVMGLVELTNLRNAMVGVPGQDGLSAEQRKRLTIAVELISSPSIIFMDEPTSGLDARAAAIVMRAIRKTVDTGRTVVCTIHQPSIEIFEAFDEVQCLKMSYFFYFGFTSLLEAMKRGGNKSFFNQSKFIILPLHS